MWRRAVDLGGGGGDVGGEMGKQPRNPPPAWVHSVQMGLYPVVWIILSEPSRYTVSLRDTKMVQKRTLAGIFRTEGFLGIC
jgi:hypothetical protein